MTTVHVGCDDGSIERKLSAVMQRLQRSHTIGATHFGWG